MSLINPCIAKEKILKIIEVSIKEKLYTDGTEEWLSKDDIPNVLIDISNKLDKILDNEKT